MKRLVDLETRECRWPVATDENGSHHFCAEPIRPGCSYCATHAVRSRSEWQPAAPGWRSPAAESVRGELVAKRPREQAAERGPRDCVEMFEQAGRV